MRTGFPRKTGLYTSPHLIHTEERIRIDSEPISKSLFAKYVFEVWDCLSRHILGTDSNIDGMPRYLQLLALVSFHTFLSEGVDVAIYETHHGGEYDATNVVQKPIVTGIAKIGMDHVKQLGPSIENIAWHKAGIFKPGAPAFSTFQEPAVAAMLQSRAAEKGVTLEFVGVDPTLPAKSRILGPKVQRKNCSLALALVGAFLERKAPREHRSLTSDDILQGIELFSWPGRFQQIVDGNYQWFLDGAHNELSAKVAAQWFAEAASEGQRYAIVLCF
jgi:folylpolyglutamate synthase